MESATPERLLSVSELNAYIKDRLEEDFLLRGISLRGEISNFKRYPSGHCYFSLKDGESLIAAVMWSSSASRLSFVPKDGDEVLVSGRVTVYVPRGSYQFSCDKMEPFGQGQELLRLQKLKEKLAKEGLFDPARKRPLPRFPEKVAVIAGKGSAGLRDVIYNIQNRWPLVRLEVFPSLVQGTEAPKALIEALGKAKAVAPDVLILARGGGSSEDLAAFNDEALVRALAAFPCPVISAVGHEVDVTLCDYVADKRVSTPTAAAVSAVPDKNEVTQSLDDSLSRLKNALEGEIKRLQAQVASLSERSFFLRPESLYEDKIRSLDEISSRLSRSMDARIAKEKERLSALKGKLDALNPAHVLKRGYGLVLDERGKPVASVEGLAPGARIETRLADGIITSEVQDVKKGEGQ